MTPFGVANIHRHTCVCVVHVYVCACVFKAEYLVLN